MTALHVQPGRGTIALMKCAIRTARYSAAYVIQGRTRARVSLSNRKKSARSMPKQHGVKWAVHEPSGRVYPTLRFGFFEVLHALCWGAFRRTFRSRNATGRDPATILFRHTLAVVSRLSYSLHELKTHTSGFSETCGDDEPKNLATGFNHNLAAGVAADSVAHYLAVFIDDVAKAIPFVMDEKCDILADGFGVVKTQIANGAYPALAPLFDELSKPDSWWESALKRGEGLRQRTTHYPDVLSLQSQLYDGDWHPQIYLYDQLTGTHLNYLSLLRDILRKLCEWLDRLLVVCIKELDQRAARDAIEWQRLESCDFLRLPGTLPTPAFSAQVPDYLYLPAVED